MPSKSSLNLISPIDGRYQKYTKDLVQYFSEAASIKYKIIAEIEYLINLTEVKGISIRKITESEKKILRSLYDLDEDETERCFRIRAFRLNYLGRYEYCLCSNAGGEHSRCLFAGFRGTRG